MSTSNLIPPPPIGYQPAIPFRYPKLALQLFALILVVIITPLLLVLNWLWHGHPVTPRFLSDPGDTVLVCVTIVATVLVHELIHGLTYRALGYRVTYGVSLRLFAAYAGAFAQFQQRNHNIIVALAPLLVLSLLLLPLLASPNPAVVLFSFTALLFNVGGASGDLYLAWRLLRLPPATRLYDVDVVTMLIFCPEATP